MIVSDLEIAIASPNFASCPKTMVTGRQRWLTIGVLVFLATLLLINTTHRLTILVVVDNIVVDNILLKIDINLYVDVDDF